MATQRRIAIAAGGTAGHVHPALAVADAYREIFSDAEIFFIGGSDGLESRLVPARGYRLETVRALPFANRSAGGKLRAIGGLLPGVVGARRLLRARRVSLVIGFGGYASAGAVIAARSLGIATAIHEANVFPGLANRWLAPLADRIYVAHDRTRSAFPKSRTLVAGNPVRREILAAGEARKIKSRAPGAPAQILVTGGSGGSDFLNQNAPALIGKLAARGLALEARHQAGEFSLAPIRAAYDKAGVPASVSEYIEDMAAAYTSADFVIACAGSQTISELSVCALPCLLVPLSSAAAEHQIDNAVAFSESGGGLWTRQETWDADRLAAQIAVLIEQPQSAASAAIPRGEADAARRLIADCEAMMAGKWRD